MNLADRYPETEDDISRIILRNDKIKSIIATEYINRIPEKNILLEIRKELMIKLMKRHKFSRIVVAKKLGLSYKTVCKEINKILNETE